MEKLPDIIHLASGKANVIKNLSYLKIPSQAPSGLDLGQWLLKFLQTQIPVSWGSLQLIMNDGDIIYSNPTVLNWDVQHIPCSTWDKKQQGPKLRKSMKAYLSNKHILCTNVLLCKVGKWCLGCSILIAGPSWSPWNSSNRLTTLGSASLSGFLILLPLTAALRIWPPNTKWREERILVENSNQDPQPSVLSIAKPS